MSDAAGSINITQEPVQEEEPVAIPLISGSLDIAELQANFNSLLYLMTEQMAVQLKLMDLVVRKELVTPEEMNDEVLAVTGNQEELTSVYNEMFTRFVGYFAALKKLQEDGRIHQAEVESPIMEDSTNG